MNVLIPKTKALVVFASLIPFWMNVASAGVLLDFNSGSGSNQTGWEWSESADGYGSVGWIMLNDPVLGTGSTYTWGRGPRSFNKTDYGAANLAIIDTQHRAPSTDTGGSLKVYSLAGSTDNQSSWWMWYDGKPLIERGVADESTDRMSFYLRVDGMAPLNKDGGYESIITNIHVGTYLCWRSGGTAYSTGDGCPYEGPGNQHYYHYLSVDPGAWVHVLLDRHPTHLRGSKITVADNPIKEAGKNYFAQLNMMYMEIRQAQISPTSYNVDEFRFYSTSTTPEPNQNDESITSLWIGYWPDADEWRLGFNDRSFATYGDESYSTFEIKWSLSPITNSNYSNANLIQPLMYSGQSYVGSVDSHGFRRPNSWGSAAFTSFKLPSSQLGNAKVVYFAVKDISKAGAHAGTRWPWTRADGHDAPNTNIKVIEYHLRAEPAAPNPPADGAGRQL